MDMLHNDFNALKLLDCKITPSTLTKLEPLHVETFWSVNAKLDQMLPLSIKAVPEHECRMPDWKMNTGV